MEIKNVIESIESAAAELESVDEGMTLEQLENLITEAENWIDEAKSNLLVLMRQKKGLE